MRSSASTTLCFQKRRRRANVRRCARRRSAMNLTSRPTDGGRTTRAAASTAGSSRAAIWQLPREGERDLLWPVGSDRWSDLTTDHVALRPSLPALQSGQSLTSSLALPHPALDPSADRLSQGPPWPQHGVARHCTATRKLSDATRHHKFHRLAAASRATDALAPLMWSCTR